MSKWSFHLKTYRIIKKSGQDNKSKHPEESKNKSSQGLWETTNNVSMYKLIAVPEEKHKCSVQDTDAHFADVIDGRSNFAPLPVIKWCYWSAVLQTGSLNRVCLRDRTINHHVHVGNMTYNPLVILLRTRQTFSLHHICCWCAHCYTCVQQTSRG